MGTVDDILSEALDALDSGNAAEQDAVKEKLLRIAEENTVAQFCLGEIFWNSSEGDISQNGAQAVFWYEKAATAGHKLAQLWLGNNYYFGLRTPLDYNRAFYWYTIAANNGITLAKYRLALCYYYGSGVEENRQNAVFWLKKAAADGFLDADLMLMEIDPTSSKITPDTVLRKYKDEIGTVEPVTLKIAKCLLHGYGLPEDPEHAFRLLNTDILKNNQEAVLLLADCYTNGLGTEKDPNRAMSLLSSLKNNAVARSKLLILRQKQV